MNLDASTMKSITQVATLLEAGAKGYGMVSAAKSNKRLAAIEDESLALREQSEMQEISDREEDVRNEARKKQKTMLAAAAASGIVPAPRSGTTMDALVKAGGRNLERDVARLNQRRTMLGQIYGLERRAGKERYRKASTSLYASGIGSIFGTLASPDLFKGGLFKE